MEYTTYEELTNLLFDKIKDSFPNMTQEEVYEIAETYINPSCVKFSECKQDLFDRDEVNKRFNYKLNYWNTDILVRFILIEWLESNYINTSVMLKQHLTSSEFKTFDNKNQLEKNMQLRDKYDKEVDELMKKYGYKHTDLFDFVKERAKRNPMRSSHGRW